MTMADVAAVVNVVDIADIVPRPGCLLAGGQDAGGDALVGTEGKGPARQDSHVHVGLTAWAWIVW